jgi:catechol 2,3-dioxygenase-like lactoylglutathione lyase family enzyme
LLGAKLVRSWKKGTTDRVKLDLNGITISLRTAGEDDNITGDSSHGGYGYDHLGLEVDDLDAAYKELKGKGITFSILPRDSENGKIAFLQGPDNITIELFQRYPDSRSPA